MATRPKFVLDAAKKIWWPRMHRDKIQVCKDCPQCIKIGINFKSIIPFNSCRSLPRLLGPNGELQ